MPALNPVAVTDTVVFALAANVAAVQVTSCGMITQLPSGQLAVVASNELPIFMVNVTPVASSVARFSSVAVTVMFLSTLTVDPAGAVTTRSTAGSTETFTASVLLLSRSSTSAETVAVIIAAPSAVGVVVRSTVRVA